MKKLLTARNLIILWMTGFIGSGILQSVFSEWFTARTPWGLNRGLQTELVIWNFGMAVVLLGILKSAKEIEHYAIPGLACISLSFNINHFIAHVQYDGIATGNLIGVAAHSSILMLTVLYYALKYFNKA